MKNWNEKRKNNYHPRKIVSLVALRAVFYFKGSRVVVFTQALFSQVLSTHRASQILITPSVNARLVKSMRARCSSDGIHFFEFYQTNGALSLRWVGTGITLFLLLLNVLLFRYEPRKVTQIIDNSRTNPQTPRNPNSQNSASDNENHDPHNNESRQSSQRKKNIEHHKLHHERVHTET